MQVKFATCLFAAAGAVSSILLATSPARAGDLFSTFSAGTFSFAKDTTVEFTFLESHGAWQSTFGILDTVTKAKTSLFAETASWGATGGTEANDWLNLDFVDRKLATFNFLAGRQYQLAYWGNEPGTKHDATFSDVKIAEGSYTYQATGPNYKGTPQFKTISFAPGVILGWEDGWEKKAGRGDGDYNDLIAGARIVGAKTPEPSLMLGLGALGLAGAVRRRRAVKVKVND